MTRGSRDEACSNGADSLASPEARSDVLDVALGVLDAGAPDSAKTAKGLLTASMKLTRDDRLELFASLPRGLCCLGDTGSFASCSARPIVSWTPSSSDNMSSSSSADGLPLVMRNTPKKVRRQPPMNLIACSAVVRSKSLYSTALPMMTHNVKETNCMGMTWVDSNLCRALFK